MDRSNVAACSLRHSAALIKMPTAALVHKYQTEITAIGSVTLLNMESYHKGNACYVDEKYERAAEVEETILLSTKC